MDICAIQLPAFQCHERGRVTLRYSSLALVHYSGLPHDHRSTPDTILVWSLEGQEQSFVICYLMDYIYLQVSVYKNL